MKTIIIDDDKSSIETLTQKLKSYKEIEFCGSANTCSTGIHLAAEVNPEVIFLDVELPDLSGLEFLMQLDNITRGWCQVIMYTGHPGYMLPAFRLNAFDYLMKPVDERELKNVVARLKERRLRDESPLHSFATANSYGDKLLLYTSTSDFRLVHIQNICAFQYNHEIRQWEVIIAGMTDPLRMKRGMKREAILNISPQFVQVSQKAIVNVDYLLEVADNTCVFYPPFERVQNITVGRHYRKALTEKFNSI